MNTLFYLILVILIGSFLFDLYLSILNYKNRNEPIPELVSDVYDEEKYKKWHLYNMENFRISLFAKTIKIIIFLTLLITGFFPALYELTLKITDSFFLQVMLFIILYSLIDSVFDFIISYYKQFSIEARYGFNKMTLKTFIMDKIKGTILMLILGGGFIYTITSLYTHYKSNFYIYTWGSILLIMIFINLFYVKLFIPIFNKLTPLEEGDLKLKIITFANKVGYEVKKISIMDASRRSTKLNAFFSGFGKMKQVVLFDTLLDKMSSDQIVSVLAHEIGHSKHNHILKNLLLSVIYISIFLLVLYFAITSDALSEAFHFKEANFGFGLILFSILIEPISIISGLLMNSLSRKFEFQADHFTNEHGYGTELIESLKILARENFSNLTPHPLYVKLRYSHPPITERIKAIID